MTASKTPERLKVVTPKAIASYPHLFEPHAASPDQKPKFSVCLVFPKGTDLTELRAMIDRAAIQKFGPKGAEMLRSGRLKHPLRSDPDDVAEKGYEAGSTFVNARSDNAPGVVSIFAEPGTTKPAKITDPQEIYAGCFIKASVTAYGYDVSGNKGVALGLNNVQKIADGPRIDGRKQAQDEFEADLNATPASLDDLTS